MFHVLCRIAIEGYAVIMRIPWSGWFLLFGCGFLMAEDTVQPAVERALPWLERESQWWIEDKDCVSCHHTTFSVWARDLAFERGYDLDAEQLKIDREWVVSQFLAPRVPDAENPEDVVKPGELNGDRNMEGIAQFLISPSSIHLDPDRRSKLIEVIKRNRNRDGSWKPGGQLPLQKRPAEETAEISRFWGQLAIDETSPFPSLDHPRSSEWYALAAMFSKKPDRIAALLKRQNPDGGWSWLDGEASSPTGTGQALLALGRLDMVEKYPEVVNQGRTWLLEHQSEDGSWKTFSTKRRDRSGRISNFWGTAWAVIGLLESSHVQ